jgi:hypothetical protein
VEHHIFHPVVPNWVLLLHNGILEAFPCSLKALLGVKG